MIHLVPLQCPTLWGQYGYNSVVTITCSKTTITNKSNASPDVGQDVGRLVQEPKEHYSSLALIAQGQGIHKNARLWPEF